MVVELSNYISYPLILCKLGEQIVQFDKYHILYFTS